MEIDVIYKHSTPKAPGTFSVNTQQQSLVREGEFTNFRANWNKCSTITAKET